MHYIIIFTLIVSIYLIPKISDVTKFLSIAIFLIILSLFRVGVGADYYSYYYLYETVDSSSLFRTLYMHTRIEELFVLIMYSFKQFNISGHLFVVLFSSIIFTFAIRWIYRSSDNKTLSILVYFSFFMFVWSWSALRQGFVLSIGSFLFFSRGRDVTIKRAIVVSVLLSMVHVSALIYIPLVFLDKMNLSKKNIVSFLMLSIIISIVPYQVILHHFNDISIVKRVLLNLDDSFSLISPSYLMRVLIALFGIFTMFQNNNSLYINRISKLFVIGFCFYFIFARFPIVGTRLSIHTYIFMVILLPNIIHISKEYRIRGSNILVFLFIISLCFISLLKELDALKIQTSFIGKERFIPYTSILNSNINDFNSKFSILISRRELDKQMKDSFTEELDLTVKEIEKDDSFILVYNSLDKMNYIINQNGEVVFNQKINGNLSLYKDVLVSEWQLPLFKELRYFDISGLNRSNEDLKQVVIEDVHRKISHATSSESITTFSVDDISDNSKSLILNHDLLLSFDVYKVSTPFSYYVGVVKYEFSTYYMYMDENMEPLFNFLLASKAKFDHNGILIAKLEKSDIVINKYGEILWID